MKWDSFLYKIVIFFTLVFFSFPINSQELIDSLIDDYISKSANHPSELIYLQTSKDVYETGEDLWFKAYQLNTQTLTVSDLSKTLYIQMLNSNDSIVWQEMYPIENGVAKGHIYIDKNLPEGDYNIEAYSRHSFYEDSTQLNGIRKVQIIRSITRESVINEASNQGFRFQTFPEGGHCISGIRSQMAFKVTDNIGNPIEMSGTIYENDTPIQEITTSHAGMGVFSFTPFAEKEYRISLSNGKSYNITDIQKEGMILHFAGEDKESLNFVVRKNDDLLQPVYLLAQVRGEVCCMAKGMLKDSLKIKIPLKEFPSQGIAEFILYDKNLIPISERLVYVHPHKKMYFTVEPDKKSYKLREKGEIKIKVSDENGNPVRAHLGVSIYDGIYDNPANPVNIFTHCYLSSHVRGRIYDPTYYFDEKNDDRFFALDLLLQTQGWRKYVWNQAILYPERKEKLTDDITGVQTIKNKKIKYTNQLIQVSGADENSTFVWTDTTGYFAINTEILNEIRGGYIYLKPMLTKNNGPKLEINNMFATINNIRGNKSIYYPYIDVTQIKKEDYSYIPVISNDSIIQLPEVVVSGKSGHIFRDKFMGKLDSLAQRDLGPWVCEHGHLENYMPGYTHHHNPAYCPCPIEAKEKNIPVIGKSYRLWKPKYLGGCAFTVEEDRTIVYQGSNFTEEELLRMNNLWRTKGYYGVREFYRPDEFDMQISAPDARNTLLWDPAVITDEKGEATVNFYCSDVNTKFQIQIEGINGVGLLGTTKDEFNVMRR